MSAPSPPTEEAEMLAKWREVREQIAADEADAAAKLLALHMEQAGVKADRERLAAVQKEIADARQQADDLDRHAALLLRSAEALEREIGTATRDVARLKASFPALEGQAREAEAKLESFREKRAAELDRVRQHLEDCKRVRKDRSKEQKAEAAKAAAAAGRGGEGASNVV